MIENVCVIAINISEIKDVTYIFVQYVVLYDGPEAYMYEIKLCYVMLFSMLAFSVSSAYTMPSFSSGGIKELDLDEMNDFRMNHYCLEDRLLDFNFSARWSFNVCLDSRIADITLLRCCLNLYQSDGFCVLFALR